MINASSLPANWDFLDKTSTRPMLCNNDAMYLRSPFQCSLFTAQILGDLEANVPPPTYSDHKWLLQHTASSKLEASPLCYVRFHNSYGAESGNSSQSSLVIADDYYRRVEHQLAEMELANEDDAVVERAAVRSALAVVSHLKKNQWAPPMLSWHGGDAIVMLWALGTATFALTVTDGELGYVLRQDRKTLEIKDSILIPTLGLEFKYSHAD